MFSVRISDFSVPNPETVDMAVASPSLCITAVTRKSKDDMRTPSTTCVLLCIEIYDSTELIDSAGIRRYSQGSSSNRIIPTSVAAKGLLDTSEHMHGVDGEYKNSDRIDDIEKEDPNVRQNDILDDNKGNIVTPISVLIGSISFSLEEAEVTYLESIEGPDIGYRSALIKGEMKVVSIIWIAEHTLVVHCRNTSGSVSYIKIAHFSAFSRSEGVDNMPHITPLSKTITLRRPGDSSPKHYTKVVDREANFVHITTIPAALVEHVVCRSSAMKLSHQKLMNSAITSYTASPTGNTSDYTITPPVSLMKDIHLFDSEGSLGASYNSTSMRIHESPPPPPLVYSSNIYKASNRHRLAQESESAVDRSHSEGYCPFLARSVLCSILSVTEDTTSVVGGYEGEGDTVSSMLEINRTTSGDARHSSASAKEDANTPTAGVCMGRGVWIYIDGIIASVQFIPIYHGMLFTFEVRHRVAVNTNTVSKYLSDIDEWRRNQFAIANTNLQKQKEVVDMFQTLPFHFDMLPLPMWTFGGRYVTVHDDESNDLKVWALQATSSVICVANVVLSGHGSCLTMFPQAGESSGEEYNTKSTEGPQKDVNSESLVLPPLIPMTQLHALISSEDGSTIFIFYRNFDISGTAVVATTLHLLDTERLIRNSDGSSSTHLRDNQNLSARQRNNTAMGNATATKMALMINSVSSKGNRKKLSRVSTLLASPAMKAAVLFAGIDFTRVVCGDELEVESSVMLPWGAIERASRAKVDLFTHQYVLSRAILSSDISKGFECTVGGKSTNYTFQPTNGEGCGTMSSTHLSDHSNFARSKHVTIKVTKSEKGMGHYYCNYTPLPKIRNVTLVDNTIVMFLSSGKVVNISHNGEVTTFDNVSSDERAPSTLPSLHRDRVWLKCSRPPLPTFVAAVTIAPEGTLVHFSTPLCPTNNLKNDVGDTTQADYSLKSPLPSSQSVNGGRATLTKDSLLGNEINHGGTFTATRLCELNAWPLDEIKEKTLHLAISESADSVFHTVSMAFRDDCVENFSNCVNPSCNEPTNVHKDRNTSPMASLHLGSHRRYGLSASDQSFRNLTAPRHQVTDASKPIKEIVQQLLLQNVIGMSERLKNTQGSGVWRPVNTLHLLSRLSRTLCIRFNYCPDDSGSRRNLRSLLKACVAMLAIVGEYCAQCSFSDCGDENNDFDGEYNRLIVEGKRIPLPFEPPTIEGDDDISMGRRHYTLEAAAKDAYFLLALRQGFLSLLSYVSEQNSIIGVLAEEIEWSSRSFGCMRKDISHNEENGNSPTSEKSITKNKIDITCKPSLEIDDVINMIGLQRMAPKDNHKISSFINNDDERFPYDRFGGTCEPDREFRENWDHFTNTLLLILSSQTSDGIQSSPLLRNTSFVVNNINITPGTAALHFVNMLIPALDSNLRTMLDHFCFPIHSTTESAPEYFRKCEMWNRVSGEPLEAAAERNATRYPFLLKHLQHLVGILVYHMLLGLVERDDKNDSKVNDTVSFLKQVVIAVLGTNEAKRWWRKLSEKTRISSLCSIMKAGSSPRKDGLIMKEVKSVYYFLVETIDSLERDIAKGYKNTFGSTSEYVHNDRRHSAFIHQFLYNARWHGEENKRYATTAMKVVKQIIQRRKNRRSEGTSRVTSSSTLTSPRTSLSGRDSWTLGTDNYGVEAMEKVMVDRIAGSTDLQRSILQWIMQVQQQEQIPCRQYNLRDDESEELFRLECKHLLATLPPCFIHFGYDGSDIEVSTEGSNSIRKSLESNKEHSATRLSQVERDLAEFLMCHTAPNENDINQAECEIESFHKTDTLRKLFLAPSDDHTSIIDKLHYASVYLREKLEFEKEEKIRAEQQTNMYIKNKADMLERAMHAALHGESPQNNDHSDNTRELKNSQDLHHIGSSRDIDMRSLHSTFDASLSRSKDRTFTNFQLQSIYLKDILSLSDIPVFERRSNPYPDRLFSYHRIPDVSLIGEASLGRGDLAPTGMIRPTDIFLFCDKPEIMNTSCSPSNSEQTCAISALVVHEWFRVVVHRLMTLIRLSHTSLVLATHSRSPASEAFERMLISLCKLDADRQKTKGEGTQQNGYLTMFFVALIQCCVQRSAFGELQWLFKRLEAVLEGREAGLISQEEVSGPISQKTPKADFFTIRNSFQEALIDIVGTLTYLDKTREDYEQEVIPCDDILILRRNYESSLEMGLRTVINMAKSVNVTLDTIANDLLKLIPSFASARTNVHFSEEHRSTYQCRKFTRKCCQTLWSAAFRCYTRSHKVENSTYRQKWSLHIEMIRVIFPSDSTTCAHGSHSEPILETFQEALSQLLHPIAFCQQLCRSGRFCFSTGSQTKVLSDTRFTFYPICAHAGDSVICHYTRESNGNERALYDWVLFLLAITMHQLAYRNCIASKVDGLALALSKKLSFLVATQEEDIANYVNSATADVAFCMLFHRASQTSNTVLPVIPTDLMFFFLIGAVQGISSCGSFWRGKCDSKETISCLESWMPVFVEATDRASCSNEKLTSESISSFTLCFIVNFLNACKSVYLSISDRLAHIITSCGNKLAALDHDAHREKPSSIRDRVYLAFFNTRHKKEHGENQREEERSPKRYFTIGKRICDPLYLSQPVPFETARIFCGKHVYTEDHNPQIKVLLEAVTRWEPGACVLHSNDDQNTNDCADISKVTLSAIPSRSLCPTDMILDCRPFTAYHYYRQLIYNHVYDVKQDINLISVARKVCLGKSHLLDVVASTGIFLNLFYCSSEHGLSISPALELRHQISHRFSVLHIEAERLFLDAAVSQLLGAVILIEEKNRKSLKTSDKPVRYVFPSRNEGEISDELSAEDVYSAIQALPFVILETGMEQNAENYRLVDNGSSCMPCNPIATLSRALTQLHNYFLLERQKTNDTWQDNDDDDTDNTLHLSLNSSSQCCGAGNNNRQSKEDIIAHVAMLLENPKRWFSASGASNSRGINSILKLQPTCALCDIVVRFKTIYSKLLMDDLDITLTPTGKVPSSDIICHYASKWLVGLPTKIDGTTNDVHPSKGKVEYNSRWVSALFQSWTLQAPPEHLIYREEEECLRWTCTDNKVVLSQGTHFCAEDWQLPIIHALLKARSDSKINPLHFLLGKRIYINNENRTCSKMILVRVMQALQVSKSQRPTEHFPVIRHAQSIIDEELQAAGLSRNIDAVIDIKSASKSIFISLLALLRHHGSQLRSSCFERFKSVASLSLFYTTDDGERAVLGYIVQTSRMYNALSNVDYGELSTVFSPNKSSGTVLDNILKPNESNGEQNYICFSSLHSFIYGILDESVQNPVASYEMSFRRFLISFEAFSRLGGGTEYNTTNRTTVHGETKFLTFLQEISVRAVRKLWNFSAENKPQLSVPSNKERMVALDILISPALRALVFTWFPSSSLNIDIFKRTTRDEICTLLRDINAFCLQEETAKSALRSSIRTHQGHEGITETEIKQRKEMSDLFSEMVLMRSTSRSLGRIFGMSSITVGENVLNPEEIDEFSLALAWGTTAINSVSDLLLDEYYAASVNDRPFSNLQTFLRDKMEFQTISVESDPFCTSSGHEATATTTMNALVQQLKKCIHDESRPSIVTAYSSFEERPAVLEELSDAIAEEVGRFEAEARVDVVRMLGEEAFKRLLLQEAASQRSKSNEGTELYKLIETQENKKHQNLLSLSSSLWTWLTSNVIEWSIMSLYAAETGESAVTYTSHQHKLLKYCTEIIRLAKKAARQRDRMGDCNTTDDVEFETQGDNCVLQTHGVPHRISMSDILPLPIRQRLMTLIFVEFFEKDAISILSMISGVRQKLFESLDVSQHIFIVPRVLAIAELVGIDLEMLRRQEEIIEDTIEEVIDECGDSLTICSDTQVNDMLETQTVKHTNPSDTSTNSQVTVLVPSMSKISSESIKSASTTTLAKPTVVLMNNNSEFCKDIILETLRQQEEALITATKGRTEHPDDITNLTEVLDAPKPKKKRVVKKIVKRVKKSARDPTTEVSHAASDVTFLETTIDHLNTTMSDVTDQQQNTLNGGEKNTEQHSSARSFMTPLPPEWISLFTASYDRNTSVQIERFFLDVVAPVIVHLSSGPSAATLMKEWLIFNSGTLGGVISASGGNRAHEQLGKTVERLLMHSDDKFHISGTNHSSYNEHAISQIPTKVQRKAMILKRRKEKSLKGELLERARMAAELENKKALAGEYEDSDESMSEALDKMMALLQSTTEYVHNGPASSPYSKSTEENIHEGVLGTGEYYDDWCSDDSNSSDDEIMNPSYGKKTSAATEGHTTDIGPTRSPVSKWERRVGRQDHSTYPTMVISAKAYLKEIKLPALFSQEGAEQLWTTSVQMTLNLVKKMNASLFKGGDSQTYDNDQKMHRQLVKATMASILVFHRPGLLHTLPHFLRLIDPVTNEQLRRCRVSVPNPDYPLQLQPSAEADILKAVERKIISEVKMDSCTCLYTPTDEGVKKNSSERSLSKLSVARAVELKSLALAAGDPVEQEQNDFEIKAAMREICFEICVDSLLHCHFVPLIIDCADRVFAREQKIYQKSMQIMEESVETFFFERSTLFQATGGSPNMSGLGESSGWNAITRVDYICSFLQELFGETTDANETNRANNSHFSTYTAAMVPVTTRLALALLVKVKSFQRSVTLPEQKYYSRVFLEPLAMLTTFMIWALQHTHDTVLASHIASDFFRVVRYALNEGDYELLRRMMFSVGDITVLKFICDAVPPLHFAALANSSPDFQFIQLHNSSIRLGLMTFFEKLSKNAERAASCRSDGDQLSSMTANMELTTLYANFYHFTALGDTLEREASDLMMNFVVSQGGTSTVSDTSLIVGSLNKEGGKGGIFDALRASSTLDFGRDSTGLISSLGSSDQQADALKKQNRLLEDMESRLLPAANFFVQDDMYERCNRCVRLLQLISVQKRYLFYKVPILGCAELLVLSSTLQDGGWNSSIGVGIPITKGSSLGAKCSDNFKKVRQRLTGKIGGEQGGHLSSSAANNTKGSPSEFAMPDHHGVSVVLDSPHGNVMALLISGASSNYYLPKEQNKAGGGHSMAISNSLLPMPALVDPVDVINVAVSYRIKEYHDWAKIIVYHTVLNGRKDFFRECLKYTIGSTRERGGSLSSKIMMEVKDQLKSYIEQKKSEGNINERNIGLYLSNYQWIETENKSCYQFWMDNKTPNGLLNTIPVGDKLKK